MAQGDMWWFRDALLKLGKEEHNLGSDTLKAGIITASTTPAKDSAVPAWGAGGSTNMSTNQVATGGSYTGPITLTYTWDAGANGPILGIDEVVLAANASNFTNGRWAIIYNDTNASKYCLGVLDLGSDTTAVSGLTLRFNSDPTDGDALKLSQA